MGYPTVAATNSSEAAGGTTSHAVNLPASISAGDLLIILFGTNFAPSTTPTDWTPFYNSPLNAGDFASYYKVASGSEGATVTVTTTSGSRSSSLSLRITGYQGTPEAATIATGQNNSVNHPTLSPSWGSAETLWLVVTGLCTNAAATFAAPADYTNGTYNKNSAVAMGVAHARRELNAASDDPAAVTTTGFPDWGAGLIGILGASATDPLTINLSDDLNAG